MAMTRPILDDGDKDEAEIKAILEWRTDHSGAYAYAYAFIFLLCNLIRLLFSFFHNAKSIFFYMLLDSKSAKVFPVSDHEYNVEAECSDGYEYVQLVDGYKDVAPISEVSPLSDYSDYSDEDYFIKIRPKDYDSGDLVKLCESALAHYEAQHPGESYKFESGHGGNYYFNIASQYNLEFCAKKANDNSIQKFEATALYHSHYESEEFIVIICFRLKDAEPPMDYDVKRYLEIGQKRANLWPGYLEEKEIATIVEFCKSALNIYNENSGEFYEFVKIQQAKRFVLRGYEYLLVFTAKKKYDIFSSTFKAYCRHLAPAIEIWSCKLL